MGANNKKAQLLTGCFLLAELLLYYLLLTAGGVAAVVTSYSSIVLCFLYVLLHRKGNGLMVGAMACTVAADFFLVVYQPQQQLWGMVFFLGAQSLYAIRLYRENPHKFLLYFRLGLIAAAELVAVLVLGPKTDALALISLCYYANLICNILAAFALWRKNKLLPIGFVLFLLCDTVIGLQVATSGYLAIPADSLLYSILFVDFNLAWVFYLPSQVCIALNCAKRNDP